MNMTDEQIKNKINEIYQNYPNYSKEQLEEAKNFLSQIKTQGSSNNHAKTLVKSIPGYHKEDEENTIPDNYTPPKNNQSGFITALLILLITSLTSGTIALTIYIYTNLSKIIYIF